MTQEILVEDVQCPGCKSHKTVAVDSRLRYCRDCKHSFARRTKRKAKQ